MKLTFEGVDVSTYADLRKLPPRGSDIGQPIDTLTVAVGDRALTKIPKVPDHGLTVQLYDDDNVTLLFGGYISRPVFSPAQIRRTWQVDCQSWAARLFETATGSLNKAAVVDWDRNHVIAILRDALKNQSFASNSGIDDAIITANEPDWPGVKATAVVAGSDWSYKQGADALADLPRLVPGVSWRMTDKIVQYGLPYEAAPFVLTNDETDADGARAVLYWDYQEEEIVGAHKNKIRRGGVGAAEETAYDEVSYVRFRRILEGPYKNDEAVPAADLRRRTYAELLSLGVKRVIRLKTKGAGFKAGQVAEVVNTQLGDIGGDVGAFPDTLQPIFLGGTHIPEKGGYRGQLVIQKVKVHALGNRTYVYELECGDYRRDFAAALAVKVA